jgi:ribosomal protein S18 acetylase RimI-like enzyme
VADVQIVPASLDDVDFLAQAMYLGSHPAPPVDVPAPADWLAGAQERTRQDVQGEVPDSTIYVICSGAARAGRLRVVRERQRLFLAGIQILPQFRNAGLGTAVITTLLREARDRAQPLELTVDKANSDAERLYRRLGFERIGEDGDDHVMRAR